MNDQIEIGAVGWEHPGWCDRFYPDDLPEEWRLTYYGNEFPLVLVPGSQWQAGALSCQLWRDDVDPSFRFVFDVSEPPDQVDAWLDCLAACAGVLGGLLAGVVAWRPLPQALLGRLRQALGQEPFLAVAGPPDPHAQVRLAVDGAVTCARVSSRQASDLPWLREFMQQMPAASGEGRRRLLFISGSPPEIQVLREAAILQQLLAAAPASGR